jgi:hypothetical protein
MWGERRGTPKLLLFTCLSMFYHTYLWKIDLNTI